MRQHTGLTLRQHLNYIFSVWHARCLNCVKHTLRENQTKISTCVLLALSISLRSHCHSLRRDLALHLRTNGLWRVRDHRLLPILVHSHKQKRTTSVAERFKVGSGMELVHLGVSHPLLSYSRSR